MNQQLAVTEAMTRKPEQKGRYAVYYANQRGDKPAVHQGRSGHSYSMWRIDPCFMDYDDAVGFLRADPSFKVIDTESNNELRISAHDIAGDNAPIKLAPHQVVASLDELTREALLARARSIVGGQRMPETTSKKEIVAFLADAAMQAKIERDALTAAEEDEREQDPAEVEIDEDSDGAAADAIFEQSGVKH